MDARNIAVAVGAALALSAGAALAQQPAQLDGAQLYQAKGCAACHGPAGSQPISPTYPMIANQNREYLAAQMRDIKSGARNNGQTNLMAPIMTTVSDEEIAALAQWLAEQP